MVAEIILLVYLLAMAAYDMIRQKISFKASVVTAIVLLALRMMAVYRGEIGWGMALSGISIGVLVIFLAWASREAVGMGDGVVFVVTGLVFNIEENMILLFVSLLLSAIVGGILLLFRCIHRKTQIPFVPFVLFGYGVMFVWKLAEWM